MSNAQTSSEAPRFLSFSSRDADSAGARIAAAYGAGAGVERAEAKGGFAMRMQLADLGALTLSRVEIQNWALTRETRESVIVVIPQDGLLLQQMRGVRLEHRPLESFAVARPFDKHTLVVRRGAGVAATVSFPALVARVERITGRACGEAMLSRMLGQIDARSPVAEALTRSANTALAEIGGLDRLGLGAFAASGYRELLLDLLAAALFPEIAHSRNPAPDCGRLVVRRARDFLRENAAQTVEISRLAAELGVSMRALQQNFKQAYGFSPRDYVVERRLELAREALLTHDHARTVADIAFASGFGDLSHFSAKYRSKYGELPSQTRQASKVA